MRRRQTFVMFILPWLLFTNERVSLLQTVHPSNAYDRIDRLLVLQCVSALAAIADTISSSYPALAKNAPCFDASGTRLHQTRGASSA